MKILVVDDERTLVKGMKFNLENEGYEVECAYDGAAAVDLARNGKFDLIILDVMMPEVDGLEACMRIREFSNVPVIMLTAKGEDADKLMGFECGAASVSGDRRDRPLERGRGGEKTARSGTRASGTRRGTTVGQRAGV